MNGGVIWVKFMDCVAQNGGLRRNDRSVTRILFAGRAYGYFAVLSVNDYEGSEMSFHTLQELNLDATRYRGLREMIDSGDYWLTRADYSVATTANIMDAEVDKVINRDD